VSGKGNRESFCSCSHGAGRAMSRNEAKRRFTLADHEAATAGIECRKDEAVIDETPMAYKPIDKVMAAQSDLVDIVHELRQVVCVKGCSDLGMIDIDGSFGEGGGQILRTSLALSMLTGTPFAMRNIRANRAKPGLRRQHSACIEVARLLCNGAVHGNAVSSSYIEFTPAGIIGADATGLTEQRVVDIGSMGSTALVVQTVLVPLLAAGSALTLTVRGGTHNPMAPPFEFLERVYLPCLRAMGADVEITLDAHGFVGSPGDRQGQLGQLTVHARPSKLAPIELIDVAPICARRATAMLSRLPTHVADRELGVIREVLGLTHAECEVRDVRNAGTGNAVMIELERATEHGPPIRELITELGERGVRAELVAQRACEQAQRYLTMNAPVGEHLADQLLLPMAVARGGRFRTGELSLHATTNIATIGKFLDVPITVERDGRTWLVEASSACRTHIEALPER
jgi:RNA 3'-terminal phosphate cyclase (ATP)